MKKGMFDDIGNTWKVIWGLILSCVVLLVGDMFVPKHHVHYPCEMHFGFYCVYGFVSCVVLVLIAKYILRPMVMRDEAYYE